MHITSSFRGSLALLVVLTCPTLAAAADTARPDASAWLGKADCRIARLEPAPDEAGVSWTGGCADGYASGKGVLAWTSVRGKTTLEATLVRGEASGKALLERSDYLYEGTTRNGLPDGEGYFQLEGRGWYEGEVAAGLPHGKGTLLTFDRSRYTGDWVRGEFHGQGTATFATGGSYTGAWKNGSPDGRGILIQAGAGHKFEGMFRNGGAASPPGTGLDEPYYDTNGAIFDFSLREGGAASQVPMHLGWHALTPEQKKLFLRNYPALAPGDEPPYPVKGAALFDKVTRVNQTLGPVEGKLGIYVLVGKDGKPLSVTAYGAPTATIVRALSTIFMIEQYKPARCRGEPCEMVYAVNFRFAVVD